MLNEVITSKPKLSPILDGKWELLEDWSILEHVIPAGFVSDLDSIPRIPVIHAMFKGRTRIAALYHDYLYATGVVDRRTADRLFYDVMKAEGVLERHRKVIYRVIRIAGWFRWNYLRAMVDD